jgi:putative ABC transport system permease protein
MLFNYLKIGIRSLLKNKTFSLINILGLATSMSVCIVIIMLVADQLSYDRHNTKRENIYRILTERDDSNDFVNLFATSPMPIADKITKDYSGVKSVTRILRGFGNSWIGIGDDLNIPIGGFFVDHNFISMFEYELEFGNPITALVEPNSVVLTKEAAEKLYDYENPVGEMIKVGEAGEYKVTGVLKRNNNKSHIKFEALASISTVKNLEADSTRSPALETWRRSTAGWVYIELNEGTNPADINKNLAQIGHEVYDDMEDIGYRFQLQNISDITPGPLLGNTIGPGLPNIFVYFLVGLAMIIMLSACFNYTNLTIARSLTRAKEIGIRKVSGAYKYQIFTQFISEAVIISVFALIISLLLLVILEPAFHQLNFASMLQWDLNASPMVYAVCLVFSVFVGLIAGIFPAILLSSFEPIKVLNSLSGIKLFSKLGMRKALLVLQFTMSLIFIISTSLVYKQLNYMVDADYGFNKSDMIKVQLNDTDYRIFKAELSKHTSIENIALASHIPAAGSTYGTGVKVNPQDEEVDFSYFAVDEGYIENLQLKLVAGRNFKNTVTKEQANQIIVNEKTAETFELGNAQDAIGQILLIDDTVQVEIIGVVADYNHQTMMQDIAPMALRYLPEEYSHVQIRYGQGKRDAAISDIKSSWEIVNPGKKMDYKDFDVAVSEFYDLIFGDLVSIVGLFSFIAIMVACLGLLGMATFTTETRLKEVSIRKVLGADEKHIIMLLSKSFMILLSIAILIAVPASYLLNGLWLDAIAYRVDLSFGTIGLSTLIILVLGALTIGSQTFKAATINPADTLKME